MAPRTLNAMRSVSGVLRTTLTYDVPMSRSTATGETRRTATTVPRTRAPTAESTDSWMVTQKAPRMS